MIPKFVPTRRPIKVAHKPEFVKAKINIREKNYSKDSKNSEFTRNAVVVSLFLHAIIFIFKMPGMKEDDTPKKEKLASIKMDFITPPESYKALKKKIAAAEELQKIDTKTEPGVQVVTTNEAGPTGDPTQKVTQKVQKSKAGSAKAGPLSSPDAPGAIGLGDSAAKGYEFKGKGLKALMGNSSKMALAAGAGKEGSRGLTSGTGIGNKGSNLTGDYRAPAGMGDGSGHLLGKDAAGNYDRSTTTRGLANKKGIDTAFVQADTVVMGSIEPEVLRKILQEYLPQFKFCYQQELQEHSEKIKGIVDLNFRIEGDGKVSTVNIKTAQTQFSSKGVTCMSNILRIIDFPKPKGGGLVDVRQPLNFFSESTKI
ncbi:MAG: AgmX/PglI C-terminal domain-containing protein [Bacteriovoracaceae bacterium]|nr:AgmX/PglI C-terminal domain-containing protein [Bacteriovoracaceae bacterium]